MKGDEMDTIVVKVSREIAKLCDGYEVELRLPKKGDLYIAFGGAVMTATYDWNTSEQFILTPKFDIAGWWPEWLLADEIWFDRDENKWALQRFGEHTRITTDEIALDFSVLDKSQVYRNPHREVGT